MKLRGPECGKARSIKRIEEAQWIIWKRQNCGVGNEITEGWGGGGDPGIGGARRLLTREAQLAFGTEC